MDERHRALIAAAVRAPSSHNTQPWLFERTESGVSLRADRTRALPVNDPHDRELTISCGAALFHLRVAAAHHGLAARVQLASGGADPDLFAVVELANDPVHAERELAGLFEAIELRSTTRGPLSGSADEVPLGLLTHTVELEGAALHRIDGATRDALASLVAEGDRAQFSDPSWRRELAAWMHPRRSGDGLTQPLGTLTVTQLVVRTFDLGASTGTHDHALVRGAPVVVVLTTDADEPLDWLAAGQALARMLLTATTQGLAAGFVNQPCQVAALRPRLGALVPPGRTPQLVVRLGRASAGPRSVRRPLDAVLI